MFKRPEEGAVWQVVYPKLFQFEKGWTVVTFFNLSPSERKLKAFCKFSVYGTQGTVFKTFVQFTDTQCNTVMKTLWWKFFSVIFLNHLDQPYPNHTPHGTCTPR